MSKPKLKWRLGEIPSGRYRSFETRAFPSATYTNGEPAAQMICKESYQTFHKDATDLEIIIMIAVWKNDTFKWVKLRNTCNSIALAKERVSNFFETDQGIDSMHPDYK